jgi:hypothetical protein
MTNSPSLTDVQHLLLTAAAHREDGSLLPLPEGVPSSAAALRKEMQSLIRAGLAAEVTSTCPEHIWRKIGRRPLGLMITDAGRAAIAVQIHDPQVFKAEAGEAAEDHDGPPPQAPSNTAPPPLRVRHTKSALVLEMLRRESGATLDELRCATNWLPHTTRAALTGLRKKGHGIEKRKRGEVSCYHLASRT